MKFELCASHLPENLSFRERCAQEINLKAVGKIVYGPVRCIDASSIDEAKELFLDLYAEDFSAIKCVGTGSVHVTET